jgi:hypothetical protein
MAYIPLRLEPRNNLNAAIATFTEDFLSDAHYLLAVNYPQGGLARSAGIMSLLAIAAASRLRIFDPVKNNKRAGTKDDDAFIGCVREFFPWSDVTIEDDQHRTRDAMRNAAAEELYKVFRNPLVHTGGATGKAHLSGKIAKWHRRPTFMHVFPGGSPEENERQIAERCTAPLAGDMLIQLGAFTSIVHTLTLYLCARRMVENLAADATAQQEIRTALSIQG